jgi:hypothetical protein
MTALSYATSNGHAACVEALVLAKAALDIQDVSYARLFACPATLILCLYAHYDIIVICNPSLIISFLGYRVINFIGVIRIVRVIVVIILEGQFEMLVLLLLVMESMV